MSNCSYAEITTISEEQKLRTREFIAGMNEEELKVALSVVDHRLLLNELLSRLDESERQKEQVKAIFG